MILVRIHLVFEAIKRKGTNTFQLHTRSNIARIIVWKDFVFGSIERKGTDTTHFHTNLKKIGN